MVLVKLWLVSFVFLVLIVWVMVGLSRLWKSVDLLVLLGLVVMMRWLWGRWRLKFFRFWRWVLVSLRKLFEGRVKGEG